MHQNVTRRVFKKYPVIVLLKSRIIRIVERDRDRSVHRSNRTIVIYKWMFV